MAVASLGRAIPDVPVGYERIDGELVEIEPMSFYSGIVAHRIAKAIGQHAPSAKKGEVYTSDLYFFIPTRDDPEQIRKPDLAYVSYKTLPEDRPLPFTGNALDLVPELVAEVVSPNDDAEDVISKARDYLRAGVKCVWVVYPGPREIYCYDAAGVRTYTDEDTLDGKPVLPGFKLPVASIFPAVE